MSQSTQVNTVYFPKPGRENTEEVLSIVKRRAEELGIKTIVIASTTGDTGVKAVEAFTGYKVVVVTHCTGIRQPDTQELKPENRAKILDKGGLILTATHAFGGIGRAVRYKLNTYQLDEIIAYTLRIFGEGMKVACEISIMAADAGLIRTDEEIISIGGTARGSDTAIVLKPANTHNFFDLRIKEILCKPRF
jgi:hypothetical protein